MSQPTNFAPDEVDPLGTPLNSLNQLFELFHNTERSPKDCLLGIEYEMFGQINRGLTPLPFEGQTSIQTLFRQVAKHSETTQDPLTPLLENGLMVALAGKRAVIALEPGGQIEIAAKPHGKLTDVVTTFTAVVKEIRDEAKKLGIDLFALGIHPFAAQKDMAQVKKARYGIMRSYMGGLSGLGLDMMTRSCAIQLNIDFTSEADMAAKTRLAAALMPFYSLLSSSVAFIDKKPATHAVERGNVWRHTDPARTGIPRIIFDNNFGYESWIHYVLDVPMYFIRRGSMYHSVPGASFRTFMQQGLLSFQPTVRDFVDHMSTIFTEVRLKPILELRSPDSLPVPVVNAFTALTWALLYNQEAFLKAQALFDGLTHHELVCLRNDVIDKGRQASFHGAFVYKTAQALLEIAQQALNDIAQQEANAEICLLLKPLFTLVARDTTYAEWIKDHITTIDELSLPSLIKAFEPFNNPLQ